MNKTNKTTSVGNELIHSNRFQNGNDGNLSYSIEKYHEDRKKRLNKKIEISGESKWTDLYKFKIDNDGNLNHYNREHKTEKE